MKPVVAKKYFGSGMTGMPVQTVSMFEKETPEWQQGCMDFLDYISGSQMQDKLKDLKKYKSLSPDYKASDYMYVNVEETDKKEYGGVEDIVHFPIMASPMNSIIGEYVKRPLNYYAISVSARGRNDHYRVKAEQLQQYAMAKINQRIIQSLVKEGHKPNEEDFQDQVNARTPEQIQDYMNKDYSDIGEQITQKLLTNLWKTENLDLEFLEGFKHGVTTAKEFYHIYSVGNRTKIKCISPLDVFYHKSPNARWISESQYAGFRLYLTPSSIIDMYRDKLSVSDIERIEELSSPEYRGQLAGKQGYRTDVYATNQGATFQQLNAEMIDEVLERFHTQGHQGYYVNNIGLIKVVQGYWKSFKKAGVLEFFDENDQPQEMLIDETYKIDKTLGQDVTWGYFNQVYQGGKIHDDIYADVRPYKHQWFDEDDLDYCPLPIEGVCYNDLHMSPTSLIDLMLPWNELYNTVAAELKKDMRKAIGKVMFMSYDNLPKIPGFTKEKWLYWVREFGIAWVGNNKSQNGNFSHYSSQDMSFAEQMIAKMNILDRLKVNCDAFGGFSQPRLANSTQVDTAKGAQQDIITSVNQTEYWFYKHSKLIERVLNHAVNIEKTHLKKDSFLRNMLDDMDIAYIETENIDMSNERMHVFITNSSEALADKEALRSLIQPAIQNGADLVDGASMILAKTQSEIRNVLDTLRKQKREQQQQEQQLKQQEIQAEQKTAADALAWEKEKTYATLASNERKAVIQTFGFQDDNLKDTDADGQPDILEINRQMYEQQAESNKLITDRMKQMTEHKKIASNEKLKNRELDIKEKEIKADYANMENDLQQTKIQARSKSKSK